jgi:hypothetical protein
METEEADFGDFRIKFLCELEAMCESLALGGVD